MHALPSHETLRVFLRRCDEPGERSAILDAVAAGIARIYAAGYHHKDCHLENVLRGDDGRLIWIDSDLRHTHRSKLQSSRLVATLDQLIDTSLDFVSDAEWRRFADVLEDRLGDSPWARVISAPALAHFRSRMPTG